MTATLDDLIAYTRKLQSDLKLDRWELRFPGNAPDDDDPKIDAQIEVEREGWVARLRFSPLFEKASPEQVRVVVLHELLHLHVDQLFTDCMDTIDGLAGPQAYAITGLLLKRQYERMTDGLAAAIASRYDLPQW